MLFRSLISGGVIAGALLVGTATTAQADPPNCTAGDLAGVMSGVNAGMSAYLLTHPDVNAFFTSLKGKSRDEMRTAIADYGQQNPQVQAEILAIRQPAADFRDRCDAPVPDGPMG
jgi:hemophore-related protein